MNSKENLQETPNKYKEENELTGRNIGTVLVNNNKVNKTDFKISSGKKSIRRSVKSGKVYNLSNEDRIFDISPYIAPNYVRDFKYEGGEQKKFRDSKKDSKRKSKKIDAKESDKKDSKRKNKKINAKESEKKENLNEKPNELEEENIQKLKQLDEDEKQIQLEDEERQKELEEEGNKQKELLEDEDEDKQMNPNENQDKIIEDKLNEEKKKIQHSENQKKLEEDEKNKGLSEEKINLDELNILIKGTIKELFEPKNVENIVYDKIIILMKCLSKENKEKFIDGLVQAIKTEEDEKRFAFILGEVSGNRQNEEKKQDTLENLKPYNEEEYPCHCSCHYGGECEE
jgi:hypothetical protein